MSEEAQAWTVAAVIILVGLLSMLLDRCHG
jgi:hypothetical protein